VAVSIDDLGVHARTEDERMIERVSSTMLDDPAVREDLEILGRQFYAVVRPGGVMNFEFWREMWKELLHSGRGIMFIAAKEFQIVGVIAAVLAPDPFTGETMLVEACWFVHQDHRGFVGLRLLSALTDAAKALGVKHLLMAHVTTSVDGDPDELYARLGFKKLEAYYVREV
jgi:L-amino acid N-acyltransferase YncA